jgi:hypothetical protein
VTLQPLNGSGSLERVVDRHCRRTRHTDHRSDPLDLGVPLEESLELLCYGLTPARRRGALFGLARVVADYLKELTW